MTATTTLAVTATSNAYRAILMYNTDVPQPVVASVVTAVEGDPDTGSGPAAYIEFIVTCASAICPSDSSFPEQTITQRGGSSWGGHHVVGSATTSWGCRLGSTAADDPQGGECRTTTLSAGEVLTTETPGPYTDPGWDYTPLANGTTAIDHCYEPRHTKLMVVTAGFDEYFKVMPPDTRGVQAWMDAVSSDISSKGCKATTREATGSEPTQTGSTAVETGSKTGSESAATTGSKSGSASTPSPTDSAGSSVGRSLAMLFGASALAALLQL